MCNITALRAGVVELVLTDTLPAGGSDLNRLWRQPSEVLEPSLYHSLRLMLQYQADAHFTLQAFVDVHSHSCSPASFLFMNPSSPNNTADSVVPANPLKHLPSAMSRDTPGFKLSRCCFDADASKSGCGRRVGALYLRSTLCYTFEISFFNCCRERTALREPAVLPKGKVCYCAVEAAGAVSRRRSAWLLELIAG